MLGQITRNLDDVQSRLQSGTEFAAEFKYDGQRAQIHASRGHDKLPFVRIFSRHLEDMTDKVRTTNCGRRADMIGPLR